MALAEARAAWQRTANRCLVQEDAKRAPKLACCPSVTPSAKQTETEPTNDADNGQDIPVTGPLPFNRTPSYSNLSPNTRWWLQTQPNYGYQKFTSSVDDQNVTCQESLNRESKDDVGEVRDPSFVSCEISKSVDDLYFDSESSWIGPEKDTPWWRTADTEELALLVAQRSVDVLENCDLPMPQNTHVKKDRSTNVRYFSHDEFSISSLVQKAGIGSHHHVRGHDSTQSSLIAGNSCRKLRKSSEDQFVLDGDRPLRDSPTYEKMPETHMHDSDASRAQLLEALRHSQTRAREAEEVMKQACAEKEHVVKLVLRQASQIFAYKQWVHLLQLENMYFQFKNSKIESASPITLPWTPLEGKKTRKGPRKFSNRKRAKKPRRRCDAGKFAIAFALGLGLVGAGLLLGWTIGWMLPTW